MKTKNVIDGLLELNHYRADKNGYHIGAEHDMIYAYATDSPLRTESLLKMIALGWF